MKNQRREKFGRLLHAPSIAYASIKKIIPVLRNAVVCGVLEECNIENEEIGIQKESLVDCHSDVAILITAIVPQKILKQSQRPILWSIADSEGNKRIRMLGEGRHTMPLQKRLQSSHIVLQ